MKVRKIILILFILSIPIVAAAQANLRVVDDATTVVFAKNGFDVKLAVENPSVDFDAAVTFEILNPADQIIARAETKRKLVRGRQDVGGIVPFSGFPEIENLIWNRLRWTVSGADGSAASSIISLSEVMPELFDLRISGPERIYSGMTFRTQVLALHPVTGKPVRNVDVSGELELSSRSDEDPVIKSSGTTNKDGFASLEFIVPARIRLSESFHRLRVIGKKSVFERVADQLFDTATRSFVYLNTDKPIYQPSQKFHVRGLFLDPGRRPLSDRDLNYKITNVNGDAVFSGTSKTTRFGVMTIDWEIPANAKLGEYSLEIDEGDDLTVGRTKFMVTRYDLPTFAVSATTAKPFYLINETTAEVKVSANYLFGKPVGRGRVRIAQERGQNGIFDPDKNVTEGETDTHGGFTGTVDLTDAVDILKRDESQMYADLTFAANFTDPSTNRTQQKRFDVRVSREAINVRFIRQAADPNPDVPFRFYVTAFYPDGTPARCDLRVEGNYRDTDLVTKLADARTNSYGAAKFEIRFPQKAFPEGLPDFNFRILADDGNGRTGSHSNRLNVAESNNQLFFKTDRTIYLPHEPLRLSVVSSEKEGPVFADVLKDGKVIYSKSFETENGRAGLLIPFREEFSGELLVNVYSFDDDWKTSATRSVIYPQKSGLSVKIRDFKENYKPNEEARLTLNVANELGETKESALGFFVIDKAIEERSQVDRRPDHMSEIRLLTGSGERFGKLTRRDLDKLDPEVPVSEELQLAAEFLLSDRRIDRRSFNSATQKYRLPLLFEKNLAKRIEPLESLLKKNYETNFVFPRNEEELRAFGAANSFDLAALRDPWQTPFRFIIRPDREFSVIEFKTAGADKKFDTDDDFSTRTIRFEWFRERQQRLNTLLSNHLQAGGEKPLKPDELKAVWKSAGIDFDAFRDESGKPLDLAASTFDRDFYKVGFGTIGNLDGEYQQEMRSQSVKQNVVVFRVTGAGVDGLPNTLDDFPVASFTVVLKETSLEPERRETIITKESISGKAGLLRGVITDAMEAVVPNAQLEIENQLTGEKLALRSNEEGEFRVPFARAGKYRIRAFAPGFKTTMIQNIVVVPGNAVWLRVRLDVGSVSETVDITASVETLMSTMNSSISNTYSASSLQSNSILGLIGGSGSSGTFTPRVREYFPETLVWKPDIVTDKNGRAAINFKLGDNLTTWKLYAVGSTENGEIALAEKEFRTFQPFFAELDPPRVLTEGDRIALPVPVRNYTEKKQKVTVSLAPNEWSRQFGVAQNVEVAANSSVNAIFDFQATAAVVDGKQKVVATAKSDGDAIEKPVTVRPNGKEIVSTESAMFDKNVAFDVNFPANAITNSRSAELKIYPNMLAHVAESVDGLLKRPYGCGEQTTSSTYPNLMILRIDKELGKNVDPQIKRKAQDYLAEGYKRLLNYQTDSGGFSYWGKSDSPRAALTAYVLRFLSDAEEFIDVDEGVVRRAQEWLLKQQGSDGRWESNDAATAFVLRTLSLAGEGDSATRERLHSSVRRFGSNNDLKDPYVLANIALAARRIGDNDIEKNIVARLRTLASTGDENWSTEETSFYGWGAAANVETTALVLQAMLGEMSAEPNAVVAADREIVSKALMFILKKKDRYGVWSSTQTTVNVLDALILLQQNNKTEVAQAAEIFVNGKKASDVALAVGSLQEPVFVDLSRFLTQSDNRVEIRGSGILNLMTAQVVSKHYVDWRDVKSESDEFEFSAKFDKTEARIGEEIACRLSAKRRSSRNGMVLIEIGLPPGADVDRASLEKAKTGGAFSRFEILPDRVVIYSWLKDGGVNFEFKFRPRFGMNAQSAPSRIYDYYNDEATLTVAPVRFLVN